MKKIDMNKSVWYKRYCPQLIEDIILPQELKSTLQGYVDTQDIPNLGLFSNLPGCLLPGTRIEVEAEPDLLTGREFNKLYPEHRFTKKELSRIRYFTGVDKIDMNLVTPMIIEIAKLTGELSYSLGACMRFEKTFTDKHLKVMYWINKYSDIQRGITEVQRIRKFRKYFDFDPKNFNSNYKQENLSDTINKIKFKILYSSASKITDICADADHNSCIEFWTFRGWTEEEAIEKVSVRQTECSLKMNDKYTPEDAHRLRGYGQTIQKYLDLGLSEPDAKAALKERQQTFTLEKCISRHGKEEGTRKWTDRQLNWQKTMKSKPQAEIDDINRRKGSGWNLDKYPPGTPGNLYYIRFYNEDIEFFKIGITKLSLDERFRFARIELDHDIIFNESFDDIEVAYNLEQNILEKYNKHRIIISTHGIETTEAFNCDIFKEFR